MHAHQTHHRSSERLTRDALEGIITPTASIGLLSLDRQWRIRYVSESLQPMFREPLSEYLAKYLWTVAPQLNGTDLEAAIRRAMSDREPVTVHTRWPGTSYRCDLHIHPTARQLSVVVVAMVDDGEPHGSE